jgi:hypothetical protein
MLTVQELWKRETGSLGTNWILTASEVLKSFMAGAV